MEGKPLPESLLRTTPLMVYTGTTRLVGAGRRSARYTTSRAASTRGALLQLNFGLTLASLQVDFRLTSG